MRFCPECRQRTDAPSCPHDATPTIDEDAFQGGDPLIGAVFDGRYEVLERIGKGGMGSVYRARQLSMGREVALKVLNPSLAQDAEAAGRFVREAKVASRLRHTNTIVVYDFGHSPQGLYMVMELLHGVPLSARLREQGTLSPGAVARLLSAVARSLSEAHAHGIVHRDLKPDNIYLNEVHGGLEVVKVLDFGVAKFVLDERSRSNSSIFETNRPVIAGTIGYLAPEQARGRDVTARSDLYALGVLAYRALVGRLPFHSDQPMAVLRMHMEDPPPPLPDELPLALRRLTMRLLAKDAASRPESAAAVADELDEFLRGPDAGAPAYAPTWSAPAPSSAPTAAIGATPASASPFREPGATFAGASTRLQQTEAMPWEAPREPPASRITARRAQLEEPPEPRSVIGPLLGVLLTTFVLGAAGWYGYKTVFQKDICRPGVYETCRVECDAGNGASCLTLAEMVEKGEGTAANPQRAVALLARGCESGSGAACVKAAQAFDKGRDVSRDRERAARFYRLGCDAGSEDACRLAR